MARLIQVPVRVTTANGRPVCFVWRSRTYEVAELFDDWRDTGEWWSGEMPKDFWRVKTTSGGVFDLYYEPDSSGWTLYREND